MQVNTGLHILPEIMVTRNDRVVAEAPIDCRCRLLQKDAMLVKDRRQLHEQRDIVLRHIEIVLQASPRVFRVRQIAHALQRRNSDHFFHRIAQGLRIGNAEHVLQQVPRPRSFGIVSARRFVMALREIVCVEIERIQERVVVH